MLLYHMPLEFLARATEGSNALEPANAPVYWALRPYLRIAPRTAPARGKAAALFARGPTAPRPNLVAALGGVGGGADSAAGDGSYNRERCTPDRRGYGASRRDDHRCGLSHRGGDQHSNRTGRRLQNRFTPDVRVEGNGLLAATYSSPGFVSGADQVLYVAAGVAFRPGVQLPGAPLGQLAGRVARDLPLAKERHRHYAERAFLHRLYSVLFRIRADANIDHHHTSLGQGEKEEQ
jgi:hypothetical protein